MRKLIEYLECVVALSYTTMILIQNVIERFSGSLFCHYSTKIMMFLAYDNGEIVISASMAVKICS
jgi:hypothetical protein